VQILVFSWWPGALSVLSDMLRSSDMSHVYGEGKGGLAHALSAFCDGNASSAALSGADVTAQRAFGHAAGSGSTGPCRMHGGGGNKLYMQSAAKGAARVLLLPLKDANAGLNLSEAQHVLLLEPSIDLACEAQARFHHM
jgi:hypothetical protein